MGIEVDLMEWILKRRWNENGDLDCPMLDSPIAKQSRSGHIEVGEATLSCGPSPGWLYASPAQDTYVAAYHGPESAPLVLMVPNGHVALPSIRSGLVIWQEGKVTINALDLQGTPKITGGELV